MNVEDAAPIPGRRFGPYRVESRLAEGGMASLWRAWVDGEPNPVVVKTMLPHVARDPDCVAMFLREATLGARFSHPNLMPIHDLGVLGGRHYIEMPFVPGPNARQMLRSHLRAGGHLPVPVALSIMSDALDGLAYLHDFHPEGDRPEGLVHRDVSPENILVGLDGRARLLDFGVATFDSATRTRAGQIKGKLHYMAPEVFTGRPSRAGRDIWAAGVTLFELLTGRRPFRAETEAEIMYKIARVTHPRASELRPDIPEALDHAVETALAAEPEARGGAIELGDRLRAILTGLDPRETTAILAEAAAVKGSGEPLPPVEIDSSDIELVSALPERGALSARSAPGRSRGPESGEDVFTLHRRPRPVLEDEGVRSLFGARPVSSESPFEARTEIKRSSEQDLRSSRAELRSSGMDLRSFGPRPQPENPFVTPAEPARPIIAPDPPDGNRARSESLRLFERGLELKRRGELEAALAAWEQASRLDPDNRAIATNVRRMREKLRR